MHRLLARQLKRLGLSEAAPPPAEGWQALLALVARTYDEQENDRRIDQRSLDVAYREMDALNDKLRRGEARYRALTSLSSDWFWETDGHHRFTDITVANPGRPNIHLGAIGMTRWELPGATPLAGTWAAHCAQLDRREPFTNFVYRHSLASGAVHYVAVSGEPFHDELGEFVGYRGVARDVTSEKVAEECIQQLATYDALTGLLNRTMLPQRMQQRLAAAREQGARFSAFFIDLDHFKQVNDRHGHAAGDAVLRETAERLRANTRHDDILARLGGDEFLIISGAVATHEVEAMTQRLLAALAEPVIFAARELRVSASIGVCRFPEDGGDAESLIQHADMAMYGAKAAGGNTATAFRAAAAPAHNAP